MKQLLWRYVFRITLVIYCVTLVTSGAVATTPITGCQEINQQGEYSLANSISASQGTTTCIRIVTSGVSLDGQGFTIQGSNEPLSKGIVVGDPKGGRITGPVIRNVVLSGWNDSIILFHTDGGSICGSTISDSGNGIYLENADGLKIANNSIHDNDVGIYFNPANGTTIGRLPGCELLMRFSFSHLTAGNYPKNSIINNRIFGIKILGINNRVMGNIITGNGFQPGGEIGGGITVSGISKIPDNNIIHVNNISSNENGVIFTVDSDSNELTANEIGSNRKYGILIITDSRNNQISSNSIRYNGKAELYLDSSSGNLITNNWVLRKTVKEKFVEISPWAIITDNNFSTLSLEPGPNIAGNRNISGNYWELADTTCSIKPTNNLGFFNSPFYPDNNSFCSKDKGRVVDERPIFHRWHSLYRPVYPADLQTCEQLRIATPLTPNGLNRLFDLVDKIRLCNIFGNPNSCRPHSGSVC